MGRGSIVVSLHRIASRFLYHMLRFDHGLVLTLGIVHRAGLVVNCDMCHVH